ncbi:hypothetical protein V6N13_031005 [Hibiscus sabdariffa]
MEIDLKCTAVGNIELANCLIEARNELQHNYADVSTVDVATSKLINGHIKATGVLFLEVKVTVRACHFLNCLQLIPSTTITRQADSMGRGSTVLRKLSEKMLAALSRGCQDLEYQTGFGILKNGLSALIGRIRFSRFNFFRASLTDFFLGFEEVLEKASFEAGGFWTSKSLHLCLSRELSSLLLVLVLVHTFFIDISED